MPTILVIDDQPATLQTFSTVLRLEGFDVETAGTGTVGLQLARANCFDVILVDLNLPDMTGVELVRLVKAHGLVVPVVVVTAFPTLDSSFEAASVGAAGYVDAPLFGEEIADVVRQALGGTTPVRHPVRSGLSDGPSHNTTTHLEADTSALDPRIREAIRTIGSNLGAPPSVQVLASRAGLSQSRFRHLFTTLTGLPVSGFIADRRLQVAARLLVVTRDNVRHIADQLRYGDVTRFRKLFRTRFGLSPKIYRTRFRLP